MCFILYKFVILIFIIRSPLKFYSTLITHYTSY